MSQSIRCDVVRDGSSEELWSTFREPHLQLFEGALCIVSSLRRSEDRVIPVLIRGATSEVACKLSGVFRGPRTAKATIRLRDDSASIVSRQRPSRSLRRTRLGELLRFDAPRAVVVSPFDPFPVPKNDPKISRFDFKSPSELFRRKSEVSTLREALIDLLLVGQALPKVLVSSKKR